MEKSLVKQIAFDLGGRRVLAEKCGVSLPAIAKWVEADKIPPKHWPTIVEQTRESRTPISYEDLAAHQKALTA